MFDETRPTSVHGEKEKDYEDYFVKCYAEVSHSLREVVQDNTNVLDIGCGKGSAERKLNIMKDGLVITCVDSDSQAIKEMQRLEEVFPDNVQMHANALDIVEADANTYLRETNISGQGAILLVATLHEINDVGNRQQYLDWLLERCSQINSADGKVLLADYYYADSVTDEEVEEFKRYQMEAIGHADSREKFVKPEDIIAAVERSKKYKIADHKTMEAVEGIDRFFYIFTLERMSNGK